MKVRFVEDSLLDETGKSVISEEILIEECLKNAAYSLKVIETVEYTIKNLGYELELTAYRYRKSALFNKIERLIAHTPAYLQTKKTAVKSSYKENAVELYLFDSKAKVESRIFRHSTRMPSRFSHKEW